MGKSTVSMAIFNSYVKLPVGNRLSWPVLVPDGPTNLQVTNPTLSAAECLRSQVAPIDSIDKLCCKASDQEGIDLASLVS